MPDFNSNGVRIHYEIEGNGPEVILVHGFAGSGEGNYIRPGIVVVLKDENRVITMDCRGHGLSEKPHETSQYGPAMLEDIINLTKHLGIQKCNFMGYSMGSSLCLNLTLQNPELVKSVVLGGFGFNPPNKINSKGLPQRNLIVEALLAKDVTTIKDQGALGFRRFAESTGCDLQALAACMEGNFRFAADAANHQKTITEIKQIKVPLMTVCGNDDNLITDSSYLAMLVPGGLHVLIQGKDHLTVVADPMLRMAVRAFFNYVNHR